jgi:uncharacterized membrane protein YfcA
MPNISLPLTDIALASFAAFLAGFVDSIVGGGGLVQVPALFILFPQFPVPAVIGTNRFASVMGTSVAAVQYARSVTIPWRTVLAAGVGAAVMSFLGAKISSLLPAATLKPIILVLMASIALYTYRRKDLGQENIMRYDEALLWVVSFAVGAATGFYNGFVGPGTGSLLVFGFVSIVGYSFLNASAISKMVNVIADASSLMFFVSGGFIRYEIALPMMVCNMAGSFLGSRMAILRGSGFVRVVFLVIVAALILRFGYDVLVPMLR